MLEAVICLPFLFLLLFMTAQLAHILYCRQVIQYAAAAAGRAVTVASETQEKDAATAAARRICALVSYTNEGGTPLKREWLKYNGRDIDGTGGAAADAAEGKLEVKIEGSGIPGTRQIEVLFRIPLLFPFAGDILAGALEWYPYEGGVSGNSPAYGFTGEYFRHLRLSGRTAVYKATAVPDSGLNYKEWN